VNVIINGEPHQLEPGATVAQAVRVVTAATEGVAVAVNDEVVRRAAWGTRPVTDGDRVEVLAAVQGG
jgi:sulfur carrier protein